MSETLKESLSAAIDNETDDFETRRVLDETVTDAELRGIWERYHLIRSVIGRDAARQAPAGMLERMWARVDAGELAEPSSADVQALELTPIAASGVARVTNRWANPVTGIAVAAAVAMVVVVGYNFEASNEVAPVMSPAALVAMPTDPESLTPAPVPVGRAALQDYPTKDDVQRNNAYMVHHAQQRGLANPANRVPFVKVAAFEAE